jgi:hypothetical protein
MRAYRIDAPGAFRFAGSQGDASKRKAELVELRAVKRTQVSLEEIEVPTGKTELLDFLNGVAEEADKSLTDGA